MENQMRVNKILISKGRFPVRSDHGGHFGIVSRIANAKKAHQKNEIQNRGKRRKGSGCKSCQQAQIICHHLDDSSIYL